METRRYRPQHGFALPQQGSIFLQHSGRVFVSSDGLAIDVKPNTNATLSNNLANIGYLRFVVEGKLTNTEGTSTLEGKVLVTVDRARRAV